MRVARKLFVVVACLAAVAWVACAPGAPKVDPAVEAEWAALTEAKDDLDGLREELSETREALKELAREVREGAEEAADAAGAEVGAGVEEGAEAAPTAEELEAKLADLEDSVVSKADDFNTKLVTYLNNAGMIEGEPLTERQAAAIAMKSDEDMVLAQEYIDKGGDYRRAIEIYQIALSLDPDNAKLQAALAAAEADRWMSEERFAVVEKGMTADEVRDAIGQVNLRNVREYPERDVTAWFYSTDDTGAAAAVWFRKNKKSGELEVYQVKYDAVQGESSAES